MGLKDSNYIRQVVGFTITGNVSTLLMFVLYVAFNNIMSYQKSYFLAYSVSVLVLYFANMLLVFKRPITWTTFLKFSFIYVLQYFAGALFLEGLVKAGVSVTYAPLLVVLLLLPVTFLLNRKV